MINLLMIIPVFTTIVCSFSFLQNKGKKGDGFWAAIIVPWILSIISVTIIVGMNLASRHSS